MTWLIVVITPLALVCLVCWGIGLILLGFFPGRAVFTPVCGECGYSLHGLNLHDHHQRCPECGCGREAWSSAPPRRSLRCIIGGAVLLGSGVAIILLLVQYAITVG